jgi:thiol-disulfide isomerase/thioredoxin
MTPFAKENGWTFDYIYDGEKQELATACGAQSTPHVFLYDGDRKLVFTGRMDDMKRISGPTDKSYLRDALDSLLAGKEIAEKTPRPFGCSTKWLYKKEIAAKDEEAWKAKPVTLEDLSLDLAQKLRANHTKNFRLINFWSTTCGPCVAEFPDLIETYRRFQNRSVEFVSISVDPMAKKPAALKFLQSRHAAIIDKTLPALQEEGRTTNNYIWSADNTDPLADAIDKEWTGALPHTVLLAPDGKVLWRGTDKVDTIELRRQLLKFVE